MNIKIVTTSQGGGAYRRTDAEGDSATTGGGTGRHPEDNLFVNLFAQGSELNLFVNLFAQGGGAYSRTNAEGDSATTGGGAGSHPEDKGEDGPHHCVGTGGRGGAAGPGQLWWGIVN